MSFLADTPIREDRQAGPARPVPMLDKNHPRCWADDASVLVTGVRAECQALGTGVLGLCPRHQKEIVEGVDGGS